MTRQPSREARLRRTAQRRGLVLAKSRRRDPLAVGYGRWFLTDARTQELVSPADGLTLDEVEEWLAPRGAVLGSSDRGPQ